jgi:hypothetical protein
VHKMKIGILGWGSLIWEPGILRVVGEWKVADLKLPLEFHCDPDSGETRLLIDLDRGEEVPVRHIQSKLTDIDSAIYNFSHKLGIHKLGMMRNRVDNNNIGFIELKGDSYTYHSRLNDHWFDVKLNYFDNIYKWIRTTSYDAVIWYEDNPHRFYRDSKPMPDHLVSLTGENLEEARTFIRNAPPEEDTPVRREMVKRGWL